MTERREVVVRFVHTTVVSDDVVPWVGGIGQDLVVIHVHPRQRYLGPRLSTVRAADHLRLWRPERFGIGAVDDDLVVIAGISAAVTVVVRSTAAAATSRRLIAS